MKCPACECTKHAVLATRTSGAVVRRTRLCDACGHRWQTVELNADSLTVYESAVKALVAMSQVAQEIQNGQTTLG